MNKQICLRKSLTQEQPTLIMSSSSVRKVTRGMSPDTLAIGAYFSTSRTSTPLSSLSARQKQLGENQH